MTSVDYESNNNKPDECRDETAEENDDQYQPIDDTPPPTPCVETGVKSPRINEEGKDEEEAVTAIKTTGPAPTQDEVGAGWSARRRRFVVFWLVLLGFMLPLIWRRIFDISRHHHIYICLPAK